MTPETADFGLLAGLLRRLCEQPLPELAPDTALAEIDGLDSVRLLEAVALLEEAMGVEFPTQALDGLEHVADLLRLMAAAR